MLFPALSVFFLLASDPAAESKKAVAMCQTAQQLAATLHDQVWPGYDARKYMLLRPEKGTEPAAIGFSPDPKAARPDIFMTLGGGYFASHSPEENLLIIFHEAFHAFQRDATRPGARWRTENAFHLFDYAALSARNHALFAIEGRILHAARQAATLDEMRTKASEFLAVRQLRQKELEPFLVEFEKGAELNEGLAEYAGTRAVVAAMEAMKQGHATAALSHVDGTRYLRAKFAPLQTITRIGRNDRLKFYYTGSAQAFLLDRLAPTWKEQVQTRALALQDLLQTAVGARNPAAEAILRAHDYEAVLKQEEEEAGRRKVEGNRLRQSVLEARGRRVTVDLSALKAIAYESFDPMNVTILDQGQRVHTRMLNLGQKDCYRATFQRPVLEDRVKKTLVMVIPDTDATTATLDGTPLPLDQPLRKTINRKLVITSARFHLEAEAGDVEVTRDGIAVTVKPRPRD